jgi:hypothetical protein
MRIRKHVAPGAALVTTLLLAGTLAGCGSESSATTDTSRTTAEDTPAPPGPTASAGVLSDARTVADQNNTMCSAPARDTVTETLWSPVVTADGVVTIRDAQAVGDGVQLLDAEGAVIAGNPHDVGHGMAVAWPYEDVRGDFPVDDQTRTSLVGMKVDDGQTVLPLWRLAFDPDSHLRGFEIDYDDGTGTVETLFVKMDMSYYRDVEAC